MFLRFDFGLGKDSTRFYRKNRQECEGYSRKIKFFGQTSVPCRAA
jgi:hypothetical protein